ncbi:hypothetical protein Pst134EB_014884 [Puccinia striiformis f. sp. tritici]|nr:hypothetical protein Pst134EB_014884 [Puccinia striiformis f. sp. tritici]
MAIIWQTTKPYATLGRKCTNAKSKAVEQRDFLMVALHVLCHKPSILIVVPRMTCQRV